MCVCVWTVAGICGKEPDGFDDERERERREEGLER